MLAVTMSLPDSRVEGALIGESCTYVGEVYVLVEGVGWAAVRGLTVVVVGTARLPVAWHLDPKTVRPVLAKSAVLQLCMRPLRQICEGRRSAATTIVLVGSALQLALPEVWQHQTASVATDVDSVMEQGDSKSCHP